MLFISWAKIKSISNPFHQSEKDSTNSTITVMLTCGLDVGMALNAARRSQKETSRQSCCICGKCFFILSLWNEFLCSFFNFIFCLKTKIKHEVYCSANHIKDKLDPFHFWR